MYRHSNDFRQSVVDFVKKKKGSKSAAVRNFGIGRQTVYDWLELDKQGKLFEVKEYQQGRKSRIDPQELKDYVKASPDKYNREIAKEFNISESQIQRILIKLKITVKKNKGRSEKRMNKLK